MGLMVRLAKSIAPENTVELSLLALLGYHYFLRVDAVLSPWFALAAFLVAAVAAGLLAASRLRNWVAVGCGIALLVVVGPLGKGLLTLFVGAQTDPTVDTLSLAFSSQWELALPLALGTYLLRFFGLRLRRNRGMMTVARAAVLVALFWSEAFFDLSLYHHPMVQAIVVGAFVILEVLFLALLAARRDGGSVGVPILAALLPIIVVVLLFLLGRYNEASLAGSGGLIRPTLFQFDFSDYLTLESEISLSRDLVLLYRRDGDVGYDLLRRYVLSGYDRRRGFFLDPAAPGGGVPQAVPTQPVAREIGDRLFREPLSQEYFLINFDSSSLLALNEPTKIIPLKPWEGASFSGIYRVESLVPRPSLGTLAGANAPSADDIPRNRSRDEEWVSYYTQYGESEAIAELAREAAGEGSDFRRVANIESFLKESYYYSLRPGIAADGNQLEHFLFESRKGYCSYFAFAMAEMVRSIGLPARVAVGFFVEPRLQILNFYSIRADMAHAWVEVYFDDMGWLEFDPTSSTLHPDEDFDMDLALDEERLNALLQEILEHQDELQVLDELQPVSEEDRSGRNLLVGVVPFVLRFWWVLTAAAYAVAMLIYRYGRLVPLLWRRSPAGRARCHYRTALRHLAAIGYQLRADESPLQFAWRLEGHDIAFEDATRWYLRMLFGRSDGDIDDEARRRDFQRLRDSVRRTVSPAVRLRAAVVPFLRRKLREEPEGIRA